MRSRAGSVNLKTKCPCGGRDVCLYVSQHPLAILADLTLTLGWMMCISDKELKRVRKIGLQIRTLKTANSDSYTWESAIDKVVSENTKDQDDFFRMKAMMAFFVDESRQMQSLGMFIDSLEDRIIHLKEKSEHYAIREETRQMLDAKISKILDDLAPKISQKNAFDVYQMMIDKIFLTNDLDTLFLWIGKLSSVLAEYFPNAFQEVHGLVVGYQQIEPIVEMAKIGATKKEILAHTRIEIDPGLFMNRLVKIGIFSQGKRGRENVYVFQSRQFDNNLLRKEWTWLYGEPYKKLSLKIYENAKYA
ncbi:hypothetical protein ACQE3D_18340 [Methylomonas sp. MS20]|uniref:hypothetical protein n=1 Tax=Methylomonas sp. MS20 TaxID=3418769 RepID=UPI00143A6CC2|nr:hypothetical protein [Methylococcaceae bacterium WWC4]